MEDRKQKAGDGYKTTENRDEEKIGEEEHQEADNILEHAIEYCMTGSYLPGLTKEKKRAV